MEYNKSSRLRERRIESILIVSRLHSVHIIIEKKLINCKQLINKTSFFIKIIYTEIYEEKTKKKKKKEKNNHCCCGSALFFVLLK